MPISAKAEEGRRARFVWRSVGAASVAGLVLLGLAYWLTYEPAPRVRVLWQDEVTPEQRAELEREYLLLNGRDQLPEGSIAYDLLDTSPSNIKALVEHPAVADTNDIERHTFVVRFDVDYGNEWMWLADRTPGLRDAWTRAGLIVVLALMAVGGLAPDGIRTWHAVRRAADVHRKQGKPAGPNVPVG